MRNPLWTKIIGKCPEIVKHYFRLFGTSFHPNQNSYPERAVRTRSLVLEINEGSYVYTGWQKSSTKE